MTKEIISESTILLNATATGRDEAIRTAGQLLVEGGYVTEKYIELMLQREELVSTYMGNNLAIPHGTNDAESEIITSGISVVQLPDGVDFGDGELAYLVIGIAGKDGSHLDILGQIAIACMEPEVIEQLRTVKNKKSVIEKLGISL